MRTRRTRTDPTPTPAPRRGASISQPAGGMRARVDVTDLSTGRGEAFVLDRDGYMVVCARDRRIVSDVEREDGSRLVVISAPVRHEQGSIDG